MNLQPDRLYISLMYLVDSVGSPLTIVLTAVVLFFICGIISSLYQAIKHYLKAF